MMFDRITFEPGKMGGRACIRGLRIPVSVIVSLIAAGNTPEEILRECPDLEREDVTQALQWGRRSRARDTHRDGWEARHV